MKTKYHKRTTELKSKPQRSHVTNSHKQGRKLGYALTGALLLACVTILGSFAVMAGETDIKNPEKAVEDFLDLLAEHKVSSVKLYYSSWAAKAWRPTMFEDDLINRYRDFEVVAYRAPIYGQFPQDLKKVLEEFGFVKTQPPARDFRLGCIFYTKDKEVLRIFFSKEDPAVSINGVLYETNPELIRLLLPLLPSQACEEIHRSMISYWVQSRTSRQPSKNTQCTRRDGKDDQPNTGN